ncbi:MAG: hypothetical protein KF901_08505 [Myxococcales bacterium]|nr:hypothetical protein [Myxococcales bacterium]
MASPRLSTPLVLAVASAMICVGLVGFLWRGGATEPAPERPALLVDDSSPERAAESFLDAWRKRAHDAALALSTGDARERVLARQRADAQLGEHERALEAEVWQTLASSRLGLQLRESERLPDERLALRGIASGEFLGEPYEREVEMVVAPADEGRWRVERFDFGDILTEPPRVLQKADR